MSISQIDSKQAYERMKDGAILVDCRSIPEFVSGHPEGAFNIPLMHMESGTGQMFPNQDFISLCEAILPKEKEILFICRSGGRSNQACQLLSEGGFVNLSNVDGGYIGNASISGWSECDLPTATGNDGDGAYEKLLAKRDQ